MTWPRFWAQRCVFQLCDRVVCNSRTGADYLRERGGIPESKLAVIPNGLPDTAFEAARSAFPKVSGVLRAGMVARMNHPAKNHTAFLQMAAKVAKTHPQVEFVLVGDGPLRSSLETEGAALGLGNKVVFLGERHDIPAILASLDVAVLTSKSESLSNAIMEAMAAGLPVVAARVGGNPELVKDGETGFLVPSGDDDAFASALRKLLDSADLRAAFGARANCEAKSRFRLDNICKQYQDLYHSVLQEKGWSPEREHKAVVEN